MKRLSAILLAAGLVCGGVAFAVDDPSEMLPNPAQEKRAEAIGAHLRCLVCQNESIEDSSAPLARDLRKVVREQVAAGKSDQQIMDWMTQRYGEFIRLAPTFSLSTALLWLMPLVALIAGLLIAWRTAMRRVATPSPLTDNERARLDALSGRE
ncbi:cytochrome c-type biogenesis protein [Gluconobacter wancherniae]|uniref:Cytochrome c-type biogenesis protein n=1 Tax=Gluconobacter wancherniae NBRC 103581 TaxID=656744 RepID=A0A511AY24_9PROT|nr:cytochrome c-type biogenesis protein [Gluconobacter wancherniae]MBF0852700.1 cytochrome c-type biogenesis protein CcmH [Gluconobacter wancherniae]GBD56587.1 cytochrome c biogenesis protein [Gluconobacter wancherniae NBRC 103581]GBR64154.1 cytochrome c-type biogenesis protein CycL [Gluconobacter wancherniae NBRC 103581]GEK92512.1 cytochrome c-type biogenesis protein CcmH [Gluconobacter wancherniae NBRC 103581]